MAPRKSTTYGISGAQAGPESQAMRPDTGMKQHERARTTELVKQLMRSAREELSPAARSLSKAQKEMVYADAADILSGEFERSVSIEQVKLVAANLRTPNNPPAKYVTKLSPLHHALLKAEADAQDIPITAVIAGIINTHFELSPEL